MMTFLIMLVSAGASIGTISSRAGEYLSLLGNSDPCACPWPIRNARGTGQSRRCMALSLNTFLVKGKKTDKRARAG